MATGSLESFPGAGDVAGLLSQLRDLQQISQRARVLGVGPQQGLVVVVSGRVLK